MSRKIASLWLLCALLIGGCALLPVEVMPTRSGITIPSITPDTAIAELTPIATSIALPAGVYDALTAMQGICYESASDAVGRVFVIQSAETHIDFYNQVDNSNLCRQPVRRYPFDFTTGDVLAGVWNAGSGCTATHTITDFQRDDNARTISITATFSTAGDCPYQLVRGLWLGIENAQGYTITITVNE
ncbi:MAG: hypothetical protein AAFN11_12330 [Chloroflexota bacterium]